MLYSVAHSKFLASLSILVGLSPSLANGREAIWIEFKSIGKHRYFIYSVRLFWPSS